MQKVSGHWYSIINYSCGGFSVVILVAYIISLFGIEESLIRLLGITVFVAVLATVQILLSFVIYPIYSKNEREYGYSLISFTVFMMMMLVIVLGSGGIMSLGLIPLLLSVLVIGAYGNAAIAFGAIGLGGYFLATRAELLDDVSKLTTADLTFLGFSALYLFLSLAVWRRHYVHYGQPEQIGSKKHAVDPSKLIEYIHDSVIVVDEDGKISQFNPACSKLVGWKVSDAKGIDYRTVFNFVDASGRKITNQDPITKCLSEGEIVNNHQIAIKTQTGKIIELGVSVSPFKGHSGNSAIAVMRDVSEQNRQQRQRAEFISTASHEMRTPIAAIEGYISLAMNPKVSVVDDKARKYLFQAHEATINLGNLFRDLLTASKSEDGRLESHPEPVELNSFLQKIVGDVRFAAEKKGLKLEYLSAAKPNEVQPLYYVMIDRERMREVITNLIDNGIKFTKEGSVGISLAGDEARIQITITDTGMGIPEEDIGHLFQKFYRIDNSETRQIGGTGLGLFICKQIIELYNGLIWAESELGKGSSFIIELPRLDQTKIKNKNLTNVTNEETIQKLAPKASDSATLEEIEKQFSVAASQTDTLDSTDTSKNKEDQSVKKL